LGNVGAVVRLAAGGGASGVVTTGTLDPWHPAVVRGAAGLHFALPVVVAPDVAAVEGPLVVFDPEGEPIQKVRVPDEAVLAFGTERHGVSDTLKARADMVVAFPMRPGVSSLNLATSVAVGLYWWRLQE
jgi:RNA methyltransferase, TrmH family